MVRLVDVVPAIADERIIERQAVRCHCGSIRAETLGTIATRMGIRSNKGDPAMSMPNQMGECLSNSISSTTGPESGPAQVQGVSKVTHPLWNDVAQ